MTVAALVAEAIAAGLDKTEWVGHPCRFFIIDDGDGQEWTDDLPEGLTSGVGDETTCVMVRADIFNEALAHLATRAAEAEGGRRGRSARPASCSVA